MKRVCYLNVRSFIYSFFNLLFIFAVILVVSPQAALAQYFEEEVLELLQTQPVVHLDSGEAVFIPNQSYYSQYVHQTPAWDRYLILSKEYFELYYYFEGEISEPGASQFYLQNVNADRATIEACNALMAEAASQNKAVAVRAADKPLNSSQLNELDVCRLFSEQPVLPTEETIEFDYLIPSAVGKSILGVSGESLKVMKKIEPRHSLQSRAIHDQCENLAQVALEEGRSFSATFGTYSLIGTRNSHVTYRNYLSCELGEEWDKTTKLSRSYIFALGFAPTGDEYRLISSPELTGGALELTNIHIDSDDFHNACVALIKENIGSGKKLSITIEDIVRREGVGAGSWVRANMITDCFVSIPGDTDDDGDVDDGDLGTMFANFGMQGVGADEGDTDGDGDVDNADLGTAFSNFTGPL